MAMSGTTQDNVTALFPQCEVCCRGLQFSVALHRLGHPFFVSPLFADRMHGVGDQKKSPLVFSLVAEYTRFCDFSPQKKDTEHEGNGNLALDGQLLDPTKVP